MTVSILILGLGMYFLVNITPDLSRVPMPSVSTMILFIDIFVINIVSSLYSDIIKADSERAWGYYGITIPDSERSVVAAKYMTVFIIFFTVFLYGSHFCFCNKRIVWSEALDFCIF